jgi:hypothetical protein
MRVLLQVNCIPAGMVTIVTKGDGALMTGSAVFLAALEAKYCDWRGERLIHELPKLFKIGRPYDRLGHYLLAMKNRGKKPHKTLSRISPLRTSGLKDLGSTPGNSSTLGIHCCRQSERRWRQPESAGIIMGTISCGFRLLTCRALCLD